MDAAEHFEVVVVGAGFAGLAAAKAYVQIAPKTNLIVLDDNRTLGGVWSADKIYDGLRSNNLRGTLEFPDFPFPDDLGISHGEHLTGQAVHQYLTAYAEHFDIAHRMRFQTKVLEAEKLEGASASGWKLLVETQQRRAIITTDKLIVCSGLTSRPQKMEMKGEAEYGAPFIHAGSLAVEAPAIIKNPDARRITVFGGSKYAWDSVYRFASAGKEIDWVIRKSGHGPTYIVKSMAKLPILGEVWAERLVTTRFITWMSPCVFGGLDGSGWWRRFLHGTWLGRKIVGGFWSNMGHDMLDQAGFNNHPSLKPLKPDADFFNYGTSFAVLNYPTDILDFVRSGQVKIHREDISHLSDHTVHLENGLALQSDALVASLGWQWASSLKFKDTELHADLGIPSLDYTPAQQKHWQAVDAQADAEVMERFPMLQTCQLPPKPEKDRQATQYVADGQPQYEPQRFYRCIAPPGLAAKGDRTLAFAGFGANITHTIKAELTGIWIYAYMNDLLTVDPAREGRDNVYHQTALVQRWSTRRHTYGFGQRFPDYIFDAIPWNDVLLRDLGLSGSRKGGSWWRECFEPYTMEDYRGVTEEWIGLHKAQLRS